MNKHGFTLMELLVVLFVLSLLSALAMPRLSSMFSSVEAAFARDEVFAQINALGYKAQRQGRGFVLQHYPLPPVVEEEVVPHQANEPSENDPLENDESATEQAVPAPVPIPLELPEGWAISSSVPIYFFSNGACSGGELLLSFRNTQYRLTLAPPFCQARLAS